MRVWVCAVCVHVCGDELLCVCACACMFMHVCEDETNTCVYAHMWGRGKHLCMCGYACACMHMCGDKMSTCVCACRQEPQSPARGHSTSQTPRGLALLPPLALDLQERHFLCLHPGHTRKVVHSSTSVA